MPRRFNRFRCYRASFGGQYGNLRARKIHFTDVFLGICLFSRRALIIFTVLGVLTLVFAASLARSNSEGLRGEWVLISVGIFWLVYLWIVILFRSNKTIKQTPNLQGVVRYIFDDTGYLIEATHSRAEVKWSAMVKWKEGKHTFLFYANPKIASIVPKRFFQNGVDVDAVHKLLQANVKKA